MMRALYVAVVSTMLMASACPIDQWSNNVSSGCRTDVECGAFRQCSPTGICQCVDSRGCGRGEFCNAVLQCQLVAGCTDNTDCEAQDEEDEDELICNVKTSRCEPKDLCFDDAHCRLNQICGSSGSCIDNCHDEGDCVLGSGCIRANPSDALGTCRANACSRTQDCRAGYNCDLVTNTCVYDMRGPFCGACQSFDPTDPQCGEPSNYCLIDTADPLGNSHFCGVDCSQEQGCPAGYECSDVIIVGPPATPQCGVEICRDGHCTTNTNISCDENEDCPFGPPGGDCARGKIGICAGTLDQQCESDDDCEGMSMGSCRKSVCSGGENSAFGFCSCVIDPDCPADECVDADLTDPNNPVAGHCYLSGHRCYDNTDCSVIACVQGGCLIGRNCAPSGDRRCGELSEP